MNTENHSPNVTVHGPDREPEVTIIGGVHGDEPAGVETIRKLRTSALEFQKPVQLVIGNPAAVEANTRYVETDLNRAYPGDETGNSEQQLATKLVELIQGTIVLSIHTTQSTDTPFAIFDVSNTRLRDITRDMSVTRCVDSTPMDGNGLAQYDDVVELEAGRQQTTHAAEQAERIATQFLQVTGAIPGTPPETTPVSYFRMVERVEKPPGDSDRACEELYEITVDNFERVEPGEVYIESASKTFRAESGFYPILMSDCGYQTMFGFKGEKVEMTDGEPASPAE